MNNFTCVCSARKQPHSPSLCYWQARGWLDFGNVIVGHNNHFQYNNLGLGKESNTFLASKCEQEDFVCAALWYVKHHLPHIRKIRHCQYLATTVYFNAKSACLFGTYIYLRMNAHLHTCWLICSKHFCPQQRSLGSCVCTIRSVSASFFASSSA